jgi:hypothetical protein
MGPALAQHFTRDRTKTPPYDISFHPNNPNHHSHEYNTIGLDITIANAKKPLPSTQNLASSEDCITTLTANADTFLRDFERRKLNRSNNTRANPPIPGKAVIGDLLRSQRLLIPMAIDDQCSNIHYTMAKCLHQSHHVNNLRSTDQMPRQCMKEQRATSIPAQCEILFEADNNWKQIQKTQSITRRFFGHSWLQHHLSQQSNKKVLVSHTHTAP